MALSKTAIRRLLMFCRYMENLPKKAQEHFHMGEWFRHTGDCDHGFKSGAVLKRAHLSKCGTVACALGWAATVPQLQRVGLTFKLSESGLGDIRFKGKQEDVYVAAAKTFAISSEQAIDLFSGVRHCANAETTQEWAAKARECIAEWKCT